MKLSMNEWMMRFLALDGKEAEAAAVVLSSLIRHDEETLERLYAKLKAKAGK